MVADQQRQLGAVIVLEQVRMGERRPVDAGVVQGAVGEPPPVEVEGTGRSFTPTKG